jgi:hypothetical protein
LIQEDIGKKLFANGCIWDNSFRKATAKDQIIWLKRCLLWITMKKRENPYYYEVKNRNEYINNFFKVLKSLEKLKQLLNEKRTEAEGMITLVRSSKV